MKRESESTLVSHRDLLLQTFIWLLRLEVGAVFIFSGFVKAVDPWGTLYKFNDYLAALSWNIWPNLILVGVFGLCALEFIVGIFIVTGSFRRSVCFVAAGLMCVMLPLSLWIAVADPVDDCGCFGDAVILSNWATFWKNVVLTIGIVLLIILNKKGGWLVTPALQWISLLVSFLFILTIELFGYISQPLIDFRPYGSGDYLVESADQTFDSPHYTFIYEKDGVKREWGEDDELPDDESGWVFVERRENVSQSPSLKNDRNFRLWDTVTGEDLTDEAISSSGSQLLIMMPDLKDVSPATTWKLNSLYEWSVKHNVRMIGVVAGSRTEIEDWEDISMASYPVFSADDTQIKEVVRGNPGVVFMREGRIVWKNSLAAINIDDFMSPEISDDPESFAIDNYAVLRNCIYLYLTLLGFLIVLSFVPKLKNYYKPMVR